MTKRIIAFLAVALLLLSLVGCSGSEQRKAKSLYKKGEYTAALEIFQALGNEEMALKCRIGYANAMMEKGDYADVQAALVEALKMPSSGWSLWVITKTAPPYTEKHVCISFGSTFWITVKLLPMVPGPSAALLTARAFFSMPIRNTPARSICSSTMKSTSLRISLTI